MRLLLTSLLALAVVLVAPAIAAPPTPRPALEGLVMPAGRSLATPTGLRLFPNHAGSAMPGWLEVFDRPAMRMLYRGYSTKEALPGGHHLVVLREQGLLGAYLFRKDQCIGQVLGEPFVLEDPDAFQNTLDRSRARTERRILANKDRTFALEATQYERRLGPMVERRVLVVLPDREDGAPVNRLALGLDVIYPATWASRMEPLALEASQGLAEFWRTRQEQAGR